MRSTRPATPTECALDILVRISSSAKEDIDMEKLRDETWKNDMERDASLYEADQIPEKEDDDW